MDSAAYVWMGIPEGAAMSPSGPWVVMRLDNELDAAEASRLRRFVIDFVTSGSGRLILDFRDVAFVDSAGLGALIGAARRLMGLGGTLRIVGARHSVLAVLRSTGVATLIPIYSSIEAAELDLGCSLASRTASTTLGADLVATVANRGIEP
jgi:anti-sigma B factor antagonist